MQGIHVLTIFRLDVKRKHFFMLCEDLKNNFTNNMLQFLGILFPTQKPSYQEYLSDLKYFKHIW